MNRPVELITNQDLEAYVDGEVHGMRRKFIAQRLETNARDRAAVDSFLSLNNGLIAMRSCVYRDLELADALRSILAKRAA